MSRENVEIVRRQTEAYARGDWEEAMSHFDPEVIYDVSRNSAEGGVYHGHAGVWKSFSDWIETWDDYRTEITAVIDAGGNKVVVASRQTGTVRGSDTPVEMTNGMVETLRNGRIVRVDIYPTLKAALDSVGLSE
jgi:ketosteroid isomerase-like protein